LDGGFRFVTLDKKVDAEALLQMERDEMVDTVIASYFDATQRRGNGLVAFPDPEYDYLVAKNSEGEGFFLVWGGADANTDFTEEVYERCAAEAAQAGLKPVYHVYARFNLYQTDNVRFYQIPDRILADFGLDIRSEPFAEDAS
jgi:adenine-specific DNA-methyltransferase